MSDEQSYTEQASLPAVIDEERLKRFCRSTGLDNAPIFDDPSGYNDPTDRLA